MRPPVPSRCYLLSVDWPVRSVLGSLSDPGIFHGPGETVAFLPAVLLVLLLGRLSRLSPRPLSTSLDLGLLCSGSTCWPALCRSTSSLLLPLACGGMEATGGRLDSLLSPGCLSLDLPLVLLEGLGSPLCPSWPPSPSVVGCILWPLWVDLPPSFLALPLPTAVAALLPWLFRSGLSSSGLRGLMERSFLPSPATSSRGTSRGER